MFEKLIKQWAWLLGSSYRPPISFIFFLHFLSPPDRKDVNSWFYPRWADFKPLPFLHVWLAIFFLFFLGAASQKGNYGISHKKLSSQSLPWDNMTPKLTAMTKSTYWQWWHWCCWWWWCWWWLKCDCSGRFRPVSHWSIAAAATTLLLHVHIFHMNIISLVVKILGASLSCLLSSYLFTIIAQLCCTFTSLTWISSARRQEYKLLICSRSSVTYYKGAVFFIQPVKVRRVTLFWALPSIRFSWNF